MNPHAERLIAIAREAGEVLLREYGKRLAVQTKADGSPVTAADLRSHELLTSRLHESGLPVLSEEQPAAYGVRRAWTQFWLIDPLDGTKEFLSHTDEFTINMALIRDMLPVIGLVYAPALGELYYAESGVGAFQVHEAGFERLPCAEPWRDRRMAISRFHDVPATAEFASANGVIDSVRIGSALKFGRLARGDVSLYPRFAGAGEWDIAAGHCVVEGAGCRIVDLRTGQPPRYNKPLLAANPFIVCAPGIELSELEIPDLT